MSIEIPLKITILGSGTSTGVPTIGCKCKVCTSDDPKEKRLRSSILMTRQDTQENLVIDTTPDFRMQMLNAKVHTLQHVLYTHTHADHCHGFDDLRAFYFLNQKPVHCYLSPEMLEEFKCRFSYAFTNTGYLGTAPQVVVKPIPNQPFSINGLEIDTIRLPHGSVLTTGFRFGSFAYITDFKEFPWEYRSLWKNKVHTMVASGLRFRSHPTHSSIDETITLFKDLGVKKGIITHLSHEVDYKRDQSSLPSHVSFAYDGLCFDV